MLISRRLLLILCYRNRTEKSLVEHAQGIYLFLTRTSKDVFLSCSTMLVKGKKKCPRKA